MSGLCVCVVLAWHFTVESAPLQLSMTISVSQPSVNTTLAINYQNDSTLHTNLPSEGRNENTEHF